MENELKKQVLSKIDDLVQLVKEDALYQEYLALSKKIEEHPTILKQMNEIKVDQKEFVRSEVKGDKILASTLDLKIKEKLNELEEYPLYLDFLEVQAELDDVFQTIREKIGKEFDARTQ